MPNFGVVKTVGGRRKFLGKTFTITSYRPEIDGQYVHYREEESKNVIAYKLDNTFCVDVDAWSFAVAQGATLLTAYLTDKEAFVYVPAAVVNASPIRILKASEGPQYRVDGAELVVWRKAPKPPGIPFIPDADCIDLDQWARG